MAGLGAVAELIAKAVERAGGASYADARVSAGEFSVAAVSKGRKTSEQAGSEGVCVRVLKNGFWGIASASTVSKESVFDCVARAQKAAHALCVGRAKGSAVLADCAPFVGKIEIKARESGVNADAEEMLLLADGQYKLAEGFGEKIADCHTALSFAKSGVAFASSEGARAVRVVERARFFSSVVARVAGVQRHYAESGGDVGGLELLKNDDWGAKTENACRRSIELLKAVSAPVGPMPVVFSGKGGGSGLVAHEAVGHAVEGDYAASDRSFFNGKVGKMVASEELSLVDDGRVGSGYGAIGFDDEGVKASKNVLIDKGVFKGFLCDRQSAFVLGQRPTGNARAQDHNRRVYVRMTNTFIAPGKWKPGEIIEDTKRGVLCNHWKAGIEDPAGGSFQLFFTDGYVIRNGELCESIYNISVSQPAALDALKNVDAIGNDSHFDAGGCGKGHADYVAVGSGGPTMRVKSLIVGGA